MRVPLMTTIKTNPAGLRACLLLALNWTYTDEKRVYQFLIEAFAEATTAGASDF